MIVPKTKVSVFGYGEGTVLRQRGNMVFVELADGMEICVAESECSPVLELNEMAKMLDSLPQNEPVLKDSSCGVKNSRRKSQTLEINLHFETLVKHKFCLESDIPLEMQIRKFHDVMRANITHKGMSIVFIHGQGDGILRKKLISELRSFWPSCSWEDEKFQNYGVRGAIRVHIK